MGLKKWGGIIRGRRNRTSSVRPASLPCRAARHNARIRHFFRILPRSEPILNLNVQRRSWLVPVRSRLAAMTNHTVRPSPTSGRRLWAGFACLAALAALGAGDPTPDEARKLIPWDSLDTEVREKLESVVDHATIHHRCPAEVFACSPDLYLLLLHDPVMTLELWKQLGESKATLDQTSPDHFKGSDGQASSGRWEFVYKTPELHVIYAEGQYKGTLLGGTLETKSVLVLRTVFFEERDGRRYVKHQLDGFVKAESGNLKPLAKALKPVFEKSVESTMKESTWFVSLLCRYATFDPRAMTEAAARLDEKVSEESRSKFRKLIAEIPPPAPARPQFTPAGGESKPIDAPSSKPRKP